jgi:glycosyltransferase involved in cell wall biosynthesis
MVTSAILFELYSNLTDTPKPIAIWHDIPNVNLIRLVRAENQKMKTSQATWVGNSKWGINQGFTDHKGFTTVIQPLMRHFESHLGCTKIQVIDSAMGRKSNIDVLRTIRNSSFLLQCSTSEGTGLPVLEALGLGVTPITTDVGVAREVLGNHLNLIVSRNPERFHELIHEELLNPTLNEESAIQIFEDFISSISKESIPRDFSKTQNISWWPRARFKRKIRLLAIWAFRYVRNLLKRSITPCWKRVAE